MDDVRVCLRESVSVCVCVCEREKNKGRDVGVSVHLSTKTRAVKFLFHPSVSSLWIFGYITCIHVFSCI